MPTPKNNLLIWCDLVFKATLGGNHTKNALNRTLVALNEFQDDVFKAVLLLHASDLLPQPQPPKAIPLP